jgi:hypothetical protein
MKTVRAGISIAAVFIITVCFVWPVFTEQAVKDGLDKNSAYSEDGGVAPVERVKSGWGDNAGDNVEEPAGYEDTSNDDDRR